MKLRPVDFSKIQALGWVNVGILKSEQYKWIEIKILRSK